MRASGKGGRNQELALAAASAERNDDRALALSMDAREFLANDDPYHFFHPLNDLIITGPTGTNVDDVMLVVVG